MSKQLIFFDMLSRTSPFLSTSSTVTRNFDYALWAVGALPPGQSTAPTSTPSAPAYPDEQTMQGYRWQSFNASGRSTAELPFQRYCTSTKEYRIPDALPTRGHTLAYN
ncbi:hypothetical protein KEM48_013182 [Puccinia striiformis f. sp. tritici PST-130]|nr:hypothetical protein KEM48_013182 [Puccinia striiformis f. sp. tritici PST-130]